MNKNIVILVLAGIALSVSLAVYFIKPAPPIGNNDVPLSADERRAVQILQLAEASCLSGQSTNAGFKLDISTDLLTQLSAASGINRDSSRGAVNYLDEQIRLVADEKIRDCLQQYMPQVRDCLLGDCNASALPGNIEFEFTYKIPENIPYLYENQVAFGLQNRLSNRILLSQPSTHYYVDSVALIPEGKKKTAAIFAVAKESYETDTDHSVRFCLQRAANIDPAANPLTRYHCNETQGCRHDELTPIWFSFCNGNNHSLFNLDFSPITSSHAAETDRAWVIPSLATLKKRDDLFGIGYTHFQLQTLSPLNVDADGYYLDLAVNGRETRVNGLPGNFSATAHDFSQPLSIDFALQNLNFSGKRNGCDQISLTLHFVKNGELTGEPVTLGRSYVALRDAREKDITHDGITYRWNGSYVRAPREYDTEVFISSILISKTLEFAANQQRIERAQQDISAMKTAFDQLGLMFEGKPLISVIRPPLTQISYGLAIGIIEDTQQVRFTFDNATATRLKTFLLQQRERGNPYRQIIKSDSFLYSIRGDKSYMASPAVCWDD